MTGGIFTLALCMATRNTKLQNFQFKLSYRITPAKSFLFKRGFKNRIMHILYRN